VRKTEKVLMQYAKCCLRCTQCALIAQVGKRRDLNLNGRRDVVRRSFLKGSLELSVLRPKVFREKEVAR
jgi:hypothetical protein